MYPEPLNIPESSCMKSIWRQTCFIFRTPFLVTITYVFPPGTLRLVYPMDSSSVRYADADCCERPIASPSEAVLVCTKSEPAPMDKRCAIDNM